MTYRHLGDGAVPVKGWVNGVPVEDEAIAQAGQVVGLRLPNGQPLVFAEGMALMPDTHVGMGATIGSVIPTKAAIIPAAVGVDLGCGMIARETSLTAADLPDGLSGLRAAIESAIPHGGPGSKGSWTEQHAGGHRLTYTKPADLDGVFQTNFGGGLADIYEKHPGIGTKRYRRKDEVHQYALGQFGSLGTGNHFIEICLDERDHVWFMLHSGSRGIGNRIGTYFIDRAKERASRGEISVPDGHGKNLAWLDAGSADFDDYIEALSWAQRYAEWNRLTMMQLVIASVARTGALPGFDVIPDTAVNCHHNYAAEETHFGEVLWITRKGAIRAAAGDLGIIPGSMGTASYIVEGKGHPESYESASHGAGRVMSRKRARAEISMAAFSGAMQGVEAPVDEDHLDEAPQAYKSIDAVMAAQEDLVSIKHTLRAVLNVKG